MGTETIVGRALEIRQERTTHPRPRTPDAELGFGRVFTDHMFVMDYDEESGWRDPRVVPHATLGLDPAAAVFHYGQAMFEGLKAFRQRDGCVSLFRADRHARRMQEGSARLCMQIPEAEIIHEAMRVLVGIERDWVPTLHGTALYIRPTLVATEPFLGVRPSRRYVFFIILSPVGPYYPGGLKPLRIWVEDSYVRAARGGLGAVKAGANYAASLLAAQEAQKRGYSQVLWLDAGGRGQLEEMGVMNLFVLIGDELVTPPLGGTILAGVTRDCILTMAGDLGVRASERALTIDELCAAHADGSLREVFGCGTAAVIAPVAELGYRDRQLTIGHGGVGAVARKLYDAITAIQYGAVADERGWVERI